MRPSDGRARAGIVAWLGACVWLGGAAPAPASAAEAECPPHWDLGGLRESFFEVRALALGGGVVSRTDRTFLGGGAAIEARLYRKPLVLDADVVAMGGVAKDPFGAPEETTALVDATIRVGGGFHRTLVGRHDVRVGGKTCHETERRRYVVALVAAPRFQNYRTRGLLVGAEGGVLAEMAGGRTGMRLGAVLTGGWASRVGDDNDGDDSSDDPVPRGGGGRLRAWFGFDHLVMFADASWMARHITFMGGFGLAFGPVP